MIRNPHVVAICGSLRAESKTRVALETALSAAADRGAKTTLVDLRTYDLPPFDADATDAGDADGLRDTVGEADAILLGSPKYHGTFSGPLKNALDYLGRDEFAGTTTGLLVVAGGSHPSPPLAHLRTVSRTLNAWTLPLEVAIPDSSSTVGDDGIADRTLEQRVEQLGEQLVEYAGVDSYPEVAAAEAGPTTGD
jgi:NAD(P)H-dependent FMN reductase